MTNRTLKEYRVRKGCAIIHRGIRYESGQIVSLPEAAAQYHGKAIEPKEKFFITPSKSEQVNPNADGESE